MDLKFDVFVTQICCFRQDKLAQLEKERELSDSAFSEEERRKHSRLFKKMQKTEKILSSALCTSLS